MSDAVKEFRHCNMDVKIMQDFEPESPREWDNLGKILYTSTRYTMGDEEVDREVIIEIEARKDVIVLPVYVYIHGGVTINTTGFSCPWDSGQSGIIYVECADVLKEWNRKRMTNKLREKVKGILRGEIATYDQFCTGDVYGYIVTHEEDEDEESCWGFYGMECCEEEARRVAESMAS